MIIIQKKIPELRFILGGGRQINHVEGLQVTEDRWTTRRQNSCLVEKNWRLYFIARQEVVVDQKITKRNYVAFIEVKEKVPMHCKTNNVRSNKKSDKPLKLKDDDSYE